MKCEEILGITLAQGAPLLRQDVFGKVLGAVHSYNSAVSQEMRIGITLPGARPSTGERQADRSTRDYAFLGNSMYLFAAENVLKDFLLRRDVKFLLNLQSPGEIVAPPGVFPVAKRLSRNRGFAVFRRERSYEKSGPAAARRMLERRIRRAEQGKTTLSEEEAARILKEVSERHMAYDGTGMTRVHKVPHLPVQSSSTGQSYALVISKEDAAELHHGDVNSYGLGCGENPAALPLF